ncbi:Metalloprotease MmpA [Enhygromyxa salina]|uniref:Metalloprotease MmpA n=1 Tax=Enhygromyxa salina TaxID=215803 RepID=A0A2S9YB85_9BACT|nr:M50 family metallopeptidase [Enhygromyxa salina]PRQ02374.1 Metalloprotease MmpA [Enhygromyxa salina]
MTWVLAILALSVLIIIHEFGHYVCAKIGGMHVDRFSVIGIGPVILKLFTWKGTEFVISAIPFGAYVHIVGMEPEEYAQDEEGNLPDPPQGYRNFRDSPLWARLLAIAGGPIANYLAAMILVIAAFAAVGVKEPVGVEVADFGLGSPAAAAGVEVGDEILAVDGEPVSGPDYRQSVIDLTQDKLGTTVELSIDREGEQLLYPVALNPEAPALNTSLTNKGEYIPISPAKAVALGAKWPFTQTARQLKGLWSLVTGKTEAKVGGPVAIAKAIKGSADRGVIDFVVFSALISTVLGMFNLLPLPALDGGRLIFLIYELIARRPPNKVLEERIHMGGMIALLGLIAWATVNDVRPEHAPIWKESAAEFEAEALKLEQADAEAAAPEAEAEAEPEPVEAPAADG